MQRMYIILNANLNFSTTKRNGFYEISSIFLHALRFIQDDEGHPWVEKLSSVQKRGVSFHLPNERMKNPAKYVPQFADVTSAPRVPLGYIDAGKTQWMPFIAGNSK